MDDRELVDMASTLRRGVPIATPVFDGAKEADIVRLPQDGRPRRVGAGVAL